MTPSQNAARKWHEFFPDREINMEFVRARKPGRKTKRQIEAQCPRWIESVRFWRGVYRLLSPCGAVFVVAPGEFVVDVFPLSHPERFTCGLQRQLSQHHAAQEAA